MHLVITDFRQAQSLRRPPKISAKLRDMMQVGLLRRRMIEDGPCCGGRMNTLGEIPPMRPTCQDTS